MDTDFSPEAIELKDKVLRHLLNFGFFVGGAGDENRPPNAEEEADRLVPPQTADKAAIRRLHAERQKYVLWSNRNWILNVEEKVLGYFANGDDIRPEAISPTLKPIRGEGWESDLFRYATYLWSVPVSRGFGHSMRYLVWDKSHKKLIGIFGLTDPVIGIKDRDEWIGWTKAQKESRLWHVLDAYILGAVPPYSELLGAKLVATLLTSNEVRDDFREKYEGKPAVISGKVRPGHLVLVTTNAALGKSSVLNRLKYSNRPIWEHVGWTSGYGHFHLDTGLVREMIDYLRWVNDPVVEKNRFGDGPHWKIRVIRRCFQSIGLDRELLRHGVKRGFYAAPPARNFEESSGGFAK